ncbi:MAG TPA: ATP-binding protein [Terracidiphilus sp.]|nr:ATP-binding protein [Terracidiphilus sp.]
MLLLANDLASAHAVREGMRRAGLTVLLETVETREEFLARVRSGSVDLILAPTTGLQNLPIAEILESSRNAAERIPLVLIGKHGDESEAVWAWQDGVSDYVRLTQLGRLPAIIERALREQRDSVRQNRMQLEIERAADVLRENQKLLTLGRLAASIAHEINNPLESVTNLLYLMEIDHGSPEKFPEYLRIAQREMNRVVQICKQTLMFSRETSTPVRLQLAELTEEVLVLYGRKIADKNLRVVRQYESSEAMTAFPGEMRQVLSNLIANAIEASSLNGRLIIRIRDTRNWSDSGVRGLRLSVADNGSGISPEARKRLGEPFFTTKGQAGTGLGLWVTRSILSRYGGNLQVRSSTSEERHGTVFSLFLPTNMRPLVVVSGASQGAAARRGRVSSTAALRRVETDEIEEDQSPLWTKEA